MVYGRIIAKSLTFRACCYATGLGSAGKAVETRRESIRGGSTAAPMPQTFSPSLPAAPFVAPLSGGIELQLDALDSARRQGLLPHDPADTAARVAERRRKLLKQRLGGLCQNPAGRCRRSAGVFMRQTHYPYQRHGLCRSFSAAYTASGVQAHSPLRPAVAGTEITASGSSPSSAECAAIGSGRARIRRTVHATGCSTADRTLPLLR